MKKYLLTAAAAIMATSNVWGQGNEYPSGYLTDETRPSQYDFIHEPPPLTSGAFAYDFYYYQWGRLERDFEVISAQALSDESAPLYQVFGQDSIIGITLIPETTPEIIKLCERATTDVATANKVVKNKYQSGQKFVSKASGLR